MECLIAIGGSILGKIAESTVEPVGRLLGYLFYYRSNIDNLRNKVRDLDNSRTRLTEQVEEAEKKDEEIEAADQKVAVKKWLDESKKLSEEAWNFLANEGRIGMQHCSSCSMVSRYKSSKKAKEMKDLVVDKIQDGGKFSEVSFRSIIPNWIENEDYKAFETRMSIEDKIMKALRDSSVKAIGVYGMPGVGKTTLAKEIAKKTKRERLFDKVAMVAVSQTPDVIKIQQEIAEQLELTLNETTQEKRADRLRDGLRKEDKLLIVLDNIWDELELGRVGIRFENDKKGCKLLFTSRSQDVGNLMKVNKNFPIEPLSHNEAMDLFKKMVGVRAEQADFKALAVDVVKECGELPIAIVTVAKALKNLEGVSHWKDALRQLRNSAPENIEGVSEKVYSSVKLSYDSLGSEEAKSLLLLCSIHEEDERIDTENLMSYGVGWGLFRDLATLDQARDRVKLLLDKLKARCLLLDGSRAHEPNIVRVMMHDVIRDVGISIASKVGLVMINFKTAFKLEECSSKGELKDKTAIFLRAHWFDKAFLDVPDHFFEETKELRALDLSYGNLESAPSSFFVLQNLVTLRLSGCELGDVTFIGELKNLEILDLSRSNVAKLPRQIGRLTRLRLLDLRHCRDLKVIEAGVISNLLRLEELYMERGFTQWEVEGGSNTSLSEIKNLSRLTILSLEIPDASVLPKDLFPEKLEKFQISIGLGTDHFCNIRNLFIRPAGIQSPNSFCLKLMKSHQVADLEILMHKSEEFHLELFNDVNIISANELEREAFPRLKKFRLEGVHSGGMKYIVNSEGHNRPCSVFPNLERLDLSDLKMLEKICHGKLAEESFGKLSVLNVWACPRLKNNVVQFSIAKRLEDITVFGCAMIKEIVCQSEDENEAQLIPEVEFPRLRRLSLTILPKLVQFFRSHLETGTSVSSMLDCPMTPLFSEKVVFPSLIDLNLAKLNIKKLWPDQLPVTSSSMQNLEKLEVDKCDSLEYLLSSTTAKGFSQLQYLCVKNCRAIEEIITAKELIEEGTSVECPSLSTLNIWNCPKLSTFLDSNSTKKDEQEGMSSVATQHFFPEKVVFPSLIDLNLAKLNIKKLWPDQLPVTSSSMQNLEKLEVDKCDSLEYLLSSTTAKGFSQLQYLCVKNCRAIEEIITAKELIEEGTSVECPSLSTLNIWNCPKLSTFLDSNSTKKDEQEGMSSVATQHFFPEKVVFPSLIDLNLAKLNIKKLWPDQLPVTSSSMQNLEKLEVDKCDSLEYLLSSTTAKGFSQLQYLCVKNCRAIEEIITAKELIEEGTSVECPSLSTLNIWNCPKLSTFLDSNSTKKDEQEGMSSVATQHFFPEKVVFPSLIDLNLAKLNIKKLWPDQLPVTSSSMQNLEKLEVDKCDSLEYLLSSTTAKGFSQLQYLCVKNCRAIEEIITAKELIEEGTSVECPSLSTLNIWNCPKLSTFLDSNSTKKDEQEGMSSVATQHFFPEKVVFPSLIDLNLAKLNIKKLWPDQLPVTSSSMQNLEKLEVDKCDSLEYLLSSTTAKGFSQLQYLCVKNCRAIEEIITAKELIEEGTSVECPSLSTLNIWNCPKLSTFLDSNSTKKDEQEGMSSVATQHFFPEKVVFPSLIDLNLAKLNIKKLWPDQLPVTSSSMQNLEKLEVDKCDSLEYLLSSTTAKGFSQLQYLCVKNCRAIEEIITAKELIEEGTSVECPSLSTLNIWNCPKLSTFLDSNSTKKDEQEGMSSVATQHFFPEKVVFPSLIDLNLAKLNIKKLWPDQLPVTSSSMQNLEKLEVDKCDSLEYLLSSTTAKGFSQLQYLCVKNCRAIEEIITAKELIEEGTSVECPSLSTLNIWNCPKLSTFLDSNSTKKDEQEGMSSVATQHFFPEKVVFPSLIDLNLAKLNIKKLWPDQLPVTSSSMQNLEKLEVDKCDSLEYLLSSTTAKGFSQLQYLCVKNCRAIEEIITAKELIEEGTSVECPSLSTLNIWNCPKLSTFLDSNSTKKDEQEGMSSVATQHFFPEKVVFPSLIDLNLAKLNIKKLWPDQLPVTSSSMQNLEKLEVDKCDSLEYLLSSTTAKGFSQLQYLCVKNCRAIEEIITAKELIEEGTSVECPSLSTLNIWNCPKLSTFLDSNSTKKDEQEGMSSVATQHFFPEKVVFPSLIDLNLAKLNIKKLWPDQLPVTSSSMQNLEKLEVDKCDSLEYLLSSTTAKGFSQLQYLCVKNCRAIEEIITAKELIEEGTSVECPSLSTLNIWNCPKLSTFLDSNSTKKDEQEGMSSVATQHFFPEKVVFPNLTELTLRDLKIKKLWPDQLPATSSFMQNLEKLKVGECHSLEYLLSSTMAKGFSQLQYLCVENCRAIEEIIATKELTEKGTSVECPSLSTLTIRNCPKLSTFLDTNSTKKDEQEGMSSVATQPLFQEKVVFPNLTGLTLGDLKIKNIWPDQLPATSSFMQNLKKLEVDECHSLEYLLSSTMAKGFSQLQYLCDKNCRAIEEIIATKELTEEGTSVECPSLSMLTILNCPKLSTFLDTNSTKKDEQEGMSSVATQPLFQEKRCGTLLPSFISFNNLKTLRVSHCPKVINLLASSTARGLVHLSTISIIKCKQLTEIITTSEQDETEGEIVFRKLKTLVLVDLPSLRRFYSGNTSITFPKLKKLILCRCPELRSFSCGTINSSKLTSIITHTDYEVVKYPWRYFEAYEEAKPKELVWEGDINTTVLKLWENDPITSIRRLFMETESI